MLLVGIVIGALIGRESVVRRLPETAGLFEMAGMPVNLRGLELIEVTSERTREDDGEYLSVHGTIVNRHRSQPYGPPRSPSSCARRTGQPVYSWNVEADRRTLHPGENGAFSRAPGCAAARSEAGSGALRPHRRHRRRA